MLQAVVTQSKFLYNREELEKQRSAQAYQKLHQAGKTEEARKDLARLALIRQQREEAARKREEKAKSGKYHDLWRCWL